MSLVFCTCKLKRAWKWEEIIHLWGEVRKKNILAHVDLTKNLVFYILSGSCISFLFYESRKICQKITLVAASLGFHIFECLSGNVLEKKKKYERIKSCSINTDTSIIFKILFWWKQETVKVITNYLKVELVVDLFKHVLASHWLHRPRTPVM